MKLNINDFRNKLYESIGLSEASFKNSDFTKDVGHYYADDVKAALFAGKKVYLGKESRTSDFITIDDFDEDLLKAAITSEDFEAAYTSKRFITNTKKGIITQLFKGDFSGAIKTSKDGVECETFGPGAVITKLQEAITAVLLEMNCDGMTNASLKFNKEEVPAEFAKKNDKFNILKWMLTSDPELGTGICAYVDFPIKEKAKFTSAMLEFVKVWGNSFVKIFNISNVKRLINSIYKTPITAGKWHFGHFGRKDQPAVRATLKEYLSGNRVGQQKDQIDKSDIVLYFNSIKANKIMRSALQALTEEEHNSLLTDAFMKKELIGISLKKITDGVSLVGVNISNAETNANGSEIADGKTIAVKYSSRNTKQNTFTSKSFTNEPRLEAEKTGELRIMVNNKESIHVGKDIILAIRTKGTSNLFAVLREANSQANLGNAKVAFAQKEVNGLPGLAFNMNEIQEAYQERPIKEQIKILFDEFRRIVRNPEGVKKFSVAFAYAAGYSVMIDDAFTQLAAPYIKIY
jgi:hypothetical protein